MSAKTISVEDYKKIKAIRQTHMMIRSGCTLVIFLAVLFMVFNAYSQLTGFSVPDFQKAAVRELTPLTPQLREQMASAYADHSTEIHSAVSSVFAEHAPSLQSRFEKEIDIFITSFPKQAGDTITDRLESGVDDYLNVLEQRYPELAKNNDLDSLLEEIFHEIVLETQGLVQKDIDDIGLAMQQIHELSQGEDIQKEVDGLIAEGQVEQRTMGIMLRRWAREFPGGDISYTIGKI